MWYTKDAPQTARELDTDLKQGLSRAEAERRLQVYGENVIDDGRRPPSFFKKLLSQFMDFMVILLLAAAVISFLVSYLQGETDYIDSIIILAIVLVNAILGVIQEDKAEKAIAALQALSAPMARVLREGAIQVIPASEVVPGDILEIETGDYIPADARLVSAVNLKAEEAALTGESLASEKDAGIRFTGPTPLGDRKNMVMASSYIVYGKGRAVVTATGMETEVGKIAGLMAAEPQEETPLQKRLTETGKLLGAGALLICAVIFVLGLLRHIPPFSMFMTAISLAVAAIPEGLTAIVTIVLAIGMQRMSKQNAVIRRLTAVETLGGAQVICSDKTGTLTQNKMQVVAVADGTSKNVTDREKRRIIAMLAALCNDSRQETGGFIGEPTEVALAEAAHDMGQSKNGLEKQMPRVGEVPFSSERKRMTTIHQVSGKGYLVVTKGAPEVVLGRCTKYLSKDGVLPFGAVQKKQAETINEDLAANALRVIAVAYRDAKTQPDARESVEQDLVFAGFMGMIDPPRPEVREAVATCLKAGIKPVMITGDHVLTARAIAENLGIYRPGDACISGEELEAMDDEELAAVISGASVFARVSPEHKVRIVKAYRSRGNVVAMTGDGVNDAPALKAADIGCAMGKTGTDVAKAAADMILTDDNFSTIVAAVREGRGIYANIKKAVHFLLSSNIGEILTIFMAMVFGWATPLLPIQLLWVNLVTDSLPAIALGLEPTPKDIMEEKPVSGGSSIFAGGLGERIALEGAMIGMLTLLAFAVGHLYYDAGIGHAVGRTMAFAVLSISQLVHAFNMRTEKSLFHISPWSNPFLLAALVVGLILQTSVIMIPSIANVFLVVPLTLEQWGFVALFSLLPILIVELEKRLAPVKA